MTPQTAIKSGLHKLVPHDCETTECRLSRLADMGPVAVEDRLRQIEREWSAGRVTKVVVAFAVLGGMGLGLALGGWWYAMPVIAGLFLLQYLFTRTSWLGRVFQEMGFRSGQAIDEERFALKALRGDFRLLPTLHDIEDKDAVSRMEGEGGPAVEFETQKMDSRDAVKEVLHATRA